MNKINNWLNHTNPWSFILLLYGIFLIIIVVVLRHKVQPADWIQIILTAGLVGITAFYATETRRQALASVKSVEKIQEQTLIQSRPVVIQKVEKIYALNTYPGVSENNTTIMRSEYFSNFVIMNVGNGL